jgi:hypothetical protein
MKMRLLCTLLLLLCSVSRAAIVNNSVDTPSAEDSLSAVFYSLDSLGNPTTADSLLLLVSGPSGQIVYRDSMAIGDSRIVCTTVRSRPVYCFSEQVSNVDGAGIPGAYSITLLAVSTSDGLETPQTFGFQVISTELSDQVAAIGETDSAAVARSIWNTPQDNHTGVGSFGRYLDAEVSGISFGSGLYARTVVAYDSTNTRVIPAAAVAVRNLDQTALLATGFTNSGGEVAFNLDSDTLILVATGTGYQFDAFDTITVAGAGVDTLFGEKFDPGTPFSPQLCRVYGWVYRPNGLPEIGATVTAQLPAGAVRSGSVIVSPYAIVAETDSIGYFSLDLIPSDSLQPAATRYEVTVSRSDGAILRERLLVPVAPSWRIDW